jgi:hypothetical protein
MAVYGVIKLTDYLDYCFKSFPKNIRYVLKFLSHVFLCMLQRKLRAKQTVQSFISANVNCKLCISIKTNVNIVLKVKWVNIL